AEFLPTRPPRLPPARTGMLPRLREPGRLTHRANAPPGLVSAPSPADGELPVRFCCRLPYAITVTGEASAHKPPWISKTIPPSGLASTGLRPAKLPRPACSSPPAR